MTFCALFLQVKIYVCVQKCEQPKPVYTKSRATFHLASWPIHSFIKIAAATSTSHRHCSQDLFIWRQARKRSQQHNGNQVAAATSEVATTANCSSSNMFIARHIVGNILRLSYLFLAKATITMARKPQQKKPQTTMPRCCWMNEWMNYFFPFRCGSNSNSSSASKSSNISSWDWLWSGIGYMELGIGHGDVNVDEDVDVVSGWMSVCVDVH